MSITTITENKKASLDTLTITIQALHVNGKQMTLSVFRQLEEGHIYQPDGTLEEDIELWGMVHYPIKERGRGGELADWWVVYSHNGILYRGNLNSPNEFLPVYTATKQLEGKNTPAARKALDEAIEAEKSWRILRDLPQLFIAV